MRFCTGKSPLTNNEPFVFFIQFIISLYSLNFAKDIKKHHSFKSPSHYPLYLFIDISIFSLIIESIAYAAFLMLHLCYQILLF